MGTIVGAGALVGQAYIPSEPPINCRSEVVQEQPKKKFSFHSIYGKLLKDALCSDLFKELYRRIPESHDSRFSFKSHAMFYAVGNKRICALSFAPTHPNEKQTYLIFKSKNREADVTRSFLIPFEGYVVGEKTPVPILSLDQAARISLESPNEDIEKAIEKVPPLVQGAMKGILGDFVQDPETRGIAITYEEDDGHQSCRSFVKPPSPFTR